MQVCDYDDRSISTQYRQHHMQVWDKRRNELVFRHKRVRCYSLPLFSALSALFSSAFSRGPLTGRSAGTIAELRLYLLFSAGGGDLRGVTVETALPPQPPVKHC